jgi:hypothetical protein
LTLKWVYYLIMFKHMLTLLLTELVAFGPVIGVFTVICHGSDGHVALEPLAHNHCDCHETDETSPIKTDNGMSGDHGHCTDVEVASGVLFSERAIKQTLSVFMTAANSAFLSFTGQNEILFGINTPPDKDFISFHTPLRTIILLA